MKARTTQNQFGPALSRAGKLTLKSNIPAYSNILIETGVDCIKVTSTNLDQGISISVPATVEEQGSLCVSGKQLAAIVKNCSSGILIRSDHHDAVVASGRFRATINGLDPKEYQIPSAELTEEHVVTMPSADLAKAINQTIFAASTDEARYILNGCLWEWQKNGIRLVATDGRQLACYDMQTEEDNEDAPNVIIPTLGMDIIKDIASESESVTISIRDKSHIRVKGVSEMWTKCIEGNFPNYHQVIPNVDKLPKIASLPREPVMMALRRIGLVINPAIPAAKMTGNGDGITIEARCSDSSGVESIDCATDEFEVSINPMFLGRMLASSDAESVIARFADPMSPVLIQADDLQYILMPMRTAPQM